MAEQGKITIAVGVDSGQAIDGLKDLQDGMKDMGTASGKASGKVVDSFDDIDKAAKDSAKAVDKSSDTAQKAMKETAKVAQKAGKQTSDAMDQKDSIVGLEGLKDKTGELDSSLKGLGGAVGLVSPEMEMLLMRTGDLSGGFEAASRLTMLTGGSMKSLLMAGGALGVGIGVLGGTWAIMSRKVKAAEERLAEAHAEMQEGIAFAKQYQHQIHSLENSVGLLADEEFALIDARKRSNDFMKDQIEEQRAERSIVGELEKDIEGLRKAQEELTSGMWDNMGAMSTLNIDFRDIGEAIELTSKQIENNEAVLSDNGIAAEIFNKKQIKSGEALARVQEELSMTEGSLARYRQEIESTDSKTERLNILFQIQAAQAREDNDAIRSLALSMSLLNDVEASLEVAALNAAKGHAILSVQMQNLGAATGPAVAAIDRMFDRLIDDAAPSAFAETFEKLKVTVDETTGSIEGNTTATEKLHDVQGMINDQMAADQDMREAAHAAVALELSDRDAIIKSYKDQKAELQSFLQAGVFGYEEYVEKIGELEANKNDDLLAHDVGVAQARLATAQAFNSQFEALMDSRSERQMQRLDQEETNALAMASQSEEAQAAVRAKFDEKRKTELNKSFKLSQATQIASATMSGGNAAVAALAPPPIGLGPNPAGIAMAALVAATTAAQIGVIANQKPSFHQGGIIGGQGDQMITAQGGEAVLNKSAVAGLGGQSGVDSLNAGGAAGGAVVVQMVYKQRVLDELIVDNLAKGGPLRRAINDSSRKAKRGRIGGRL